MRSSAFGHVCGVLLIALLWVLMIGDNSAPHPALAQTVNSPWLVYSVFPDRKSPGSGGLWIMHPDGSEKRQIAAGKGILSMAASPDGKHVAYYAYDPDPDRGEKNITLDLLTLPEGITRTITPLTTPATEMKEPGNEGPTTAFELEGPPLQWSPDGQTLAFIGAQGASQSADLFVYSVNTNSVKGLSSGPSQAVAPSWSPDGKYILHRGVESFGSGAGGSYAGVWVARADGSGVTTLYKPTGGGEGSLGWVDSTTFLAWSWAIDCSNQQIRAYNVETKSEVMWVKNSYQTAAYAPSAGVLMVSVEPAYGSCPNDLIPGLYRLTKTDPTPVPISDEIPVFLDWSPEAGAFFALLPPSSSKLVRITLDGKVSDVISGIHNMPIVSPDGKVWAWINDSHNTLNIGNVTDITLETPIKISEGVGDAVWVR